MDSFIIGIQLLLAGVFAFAGAAKFFDLKGSRQAVTDFGVPQALAPLVSVLLPLVELAIAVALLVHPSTRWGGVAALALLLGFSAGIANAMAHGKDVDCGCFGRVYSAVAGSRALVRNLVLAGLAAILVVHGPGPAIDDWVSARSAAELVAIGATLAALALAAFSYWLWSQNRRLRTEGVATPDPDEPTKLPKGEREGLPVGAAAPRFTLTDLEGETRTLESLLARGRPVVIEFINLGCAPCRELLPALARWQSALSDRVTIVVVTSSSPDDRAMWEEHGFSDVMLDQAGEVFDAFGLFATPKAVAIDVNGKVAAAPAGGMHMPEVLVRLMIGRSGADDRVMPSPSAVPPVPPNEPHTA